MNYATSGWETFEAQVLLNVVFLVFKFLYLIWWLLSSLDTNRNKSCLTFTRHRTRHFVDRTFQKRHKIISQSQSGFAPSQPSYHILRVESEQISRNTREQFLGLHHFLKTVFTEKCINNLNSHVISHTFSSTFEATELRSMN